MLDYTDYNWKRLQHMNDLNTLVSLIEEKKDSLSAWLKTHEDAKNIPLYASVDIRNAGFKIAVVDTNLFPAGFNNLCKLTLPQASITFKHSIQSRVKDCTSILLIIEEHTRNTWYLENVHVLESIINNAGFKVTIASFLEECPDTQNQFNYITLETFKGNSVRVHSLKDILSKFNPDHSNFDMIILNNDLTTGIPNILAQSNIPIYPSLKAGWHARLKSHHFKVANDLIEEFCNQLDIDPWLFSCLFEVVSDVDINNENSRNRLYESAVALFKSIQVKYDQYGIKEQPFIFLKSNTGTYGMGVMPIESPAEILSLNRKSRNKLAKGKSSQTIESFILQEGVPTINNINNNVSEICIYSIANQFAGGFYRVNNSKSGRENLNSTGMTFRQMCIPPNVTCKLSDSKENDECGIEPDHHYSLYTLLAQLAGISAQREVLELEKK